MNNSTTSSEAQLIDIIKYRLLASIGVPSVIMGTIGNLLNILLFTRYSIWRQSSCIPYLLGSSIASLFIIYATTLIRALLGFQITPLYYNRVLCKIVVYVSTTANVSATWFMIGACFNRYTSSSNKDIRRLIGNIKTTRRIMYTIIFITLIVYTEILICYESGNTITITPCANKNTLCGTVDACLAFIFQLITPLLFILFFGIGTFLNVKQASQIRHIPVASIVSGLSKRKKVNMANERVILRVVCVEVIAFCICTFPNIASKIYQLVPVTRNKSDVRRSIENLLINMCSLIYTLDKAYLFYIYTLASGRFRKELKRLISSFLPRTQIMPEN